MLIRTYNVVLIITVENISSNRFETKNLKLNINVKQG
jgi:hypothetical protein